ncbi:MAG: ATP-binding cassette domain-containing protein [Gemmatimonadales bacterium]|nr:ATP-binding cassette domain-containing protein [Gemmatimonadales bacterium]
MPTSVELRRASVIYPNGVKALSDVDLTVTQGEFVFLVGPTGHGKSTLLKLLYRDESPSRGEVLVFGWDVAKLSPGRVAHLRRRVGVIFQDCRLLPRTAWENVAFALHATGSTYRQVLRSVPRALAEVGLLDKADDYAAELSAGEQQSLALARVLALRPPLILADEPTGNLDPDSSAHVMSLLSKANRAGATVIMATHDPSLVNRFRKRVIALRDGAIFSDVPSGGYPDDLDGD